MLVAVQVLVIGLYLAPVFRCDVDEFVRPAQTIISLPVQTAECPPRPTGVLAVAVQLSVLGLYLLPVFKPSEDERFPPPHKIISLPVQTVT